ncbi:hypothetical protein BGW80DRAFT_1339027 [Lactifluus volemus]|nr:hypothetical protein BGW80DRAFT_1339027 [Lactifluus volemus]
MDRYGPTSAYRNFSVWWSRWHLGRSWSSQMNLERGWVGSNALLFVVCGAW